MHGVMFVFVAPSYTYQAGTTGGDTFDDYYQDRSFTSARYDGDRSRGSSDRDYNR